MRTNQILAVQRMILLKVGNTKLEPTGRMHGVSHVYYQPVRSRSKYTPHQRAQEMQRRIAK